MKDQIELMIDQVINEEEKPYSSFAPEGTEWDPNIPVTSAKEGDYYAHVHVDGTVTPLKIVKIEKVRDLETGRREVAFVLSNGKKVRFDSYGVFQGYMKEEK